MQMYVAIVEVAHRKFDDDQVDQVLTHLDTHSPAAARSDRGWLEVTVSVPALDLAQAAATGCMLVERATGKAAVACTVLTERERDERDGLAPVPPMQLLSVTEAAEKLGVSRQAVLQRLTSGSLSGEKVGREWVLPMNQAAFRDRG